MPFLRGLLRRIRAASAAIWTALLVGLLAAVYVIVLPPFALARRLARTPAPGWHPRADRHVASPARLRAPY